MTHPSDTGPAPVLALRDVAKSFGAVRALRGVSWSCFPVRSTPSPVRTARASRP